MVQNPHFASWTQLSAQTAGNAAAAAAAAAAAVHPGAASFQFPNANSLQQHLQPPDSSTATSRGVTLENSTPVTGINNPNFSLVKQKRKSKTTSKKLQVEVISSSVVYNTNIPTCGVVSTLCSTSTAATSFGMIPLNGSLSSISSTVQTNSVSSNPVASISETCVSPLTTVLSPLPTLPEEILLKIDPSLGDPPPPPHADITITKPYQCDICFKRYSGLKSLKNHKLTHSDIRPHKCSICGKAFLRADKMRLHEISHLNVKPFECATCKQRFTRSDKLKIHHRTHTGVRPYACTFCPKRFTRSDKLKIHERIHTKVKPYECSHCGKCFARSDKRRLHEKTHMYGPKPRATGGKKSKTTSAAAAAAAAAAAVVAAASAASFLTVNSIGKTLGLPLTVATPSISVNNSSCNVFDFSSITNVCTTNQNNICFPSYHVVSSTPSTGNEKSDDAQQIPTSLSTISFPLPTCQHLHLPSQHHSTLASLAGIAQYHPALFSANPRQFPHTATVANPVSFYPTNQTTSMGFTTANSGSYPHAQVMPFLVNSSNTGPSSSISLLGSNTVSDNTNSNCSVANASSVYQSSSSQKMGTVVTSFPASTPSVTQRSEISSIADSVPMNPSSSAVSNTNIAAVMAAAALGRQFHQSQQQYPQIVAYSGSQQMPTVSAFIHQQQPAAQFIPGVVPAQYAAAAAAHSTHQQYMQVQQQQQQYLAAAAAAAAASSGPIHSLTLTTSHQPNSTTSITPTTSSVIT
ncbi:Zinc finger protein 709 [Schistosoma japonicum]|nr:Zinc finger protein 709 [Schistosoma japonicum]